MRERVNNNSILGYENSLLQIADQRFGVFICFS